MVVLVNRDDMPPRPAGQGGSHGDWLWLFLVGVVTFLVCLALGCQFFIEVASAQ